jgi:carbon-monoxide dehydrogenase small subunit
VLVDGQPVRACLMFAGQTNGRQITTIEGLAAPDGTLHPLQKAFWDRHGLQCGFCTPGVLMTLVAYLREQPDADETDIRDVISGNICRCTGYETIVDAALDAVQAMRRPR